MVKQSPAEARMEWLGGGVFRDVAPVWLMGGRVLVVSCGRHLKVYRLVRDLDDAQHSAATEGYKLLYVGRVLAHDRSISAMAAMGRARVVTASVDGTLRIWDASDPVQLECERIFDLGNAVVSLTAAPSSTLGPTPAPLNTNATYAVTAASQLFRISFSPERPDVPVLEKVLGNLNAHRLEFADDKEKGVLGRAPELADVPRIQVPQQSQPEHHAAQGHLHSVAKPVKCRSVAAMQVALPSSSVCTRCEVVWIARHKVLYGVFLYWTHGDISEGASAGADGRDRRAIPLPRKPVIRTEVYTLIHGEHIHALALRQSDGSVAIGDATGAIYMFPNLTERARLHLEQKRSGSDRAHVTLAEQKHAVPHARMHWHASAVCTLGFDDDERANSDAALTADADMLMVSGASLLFSGGDEGVLVEWDVAENGLGLSETHAPRKRFLPRLGGRLLALKPSPDRTLLCTVSADNVIRLIQLAEQKVCAQVFGFRGAMPSEDIVDGTGASYTRDRARHATCSKCQSSACVDLVGDPSWRGVVFVRSSGGAGSVQVYDTVRDAQVSQMNVAMTNQTHSVVAGSGGGISQTFSAFVAHFQVGADHAASIDRRCSRSLRRTDAVHWLVRGGESSHAANAETEPHWFHSDCLKFWTRKRVGSASYGSEDALSLICRVDHPHGDAAVNSLALNRQGDLAVTTSAEDRSFRVWAYMHENQQSGQPQVQWQCVYVGQYQNLACQHAAFSADSSLLCVAFENVLGFWSITVLDEATSIDQDPSAGGKRLSFQCEFVRALAHAGPRAWIRSVGFAGGNAGASTKVVCVTGDDLQVWNVIGWNLFWGCSLRLAHSSVNDGQLMVCDPSSSRFAAVISLIDEKARINLKAKGNGAQFLRHAVAVYSAASAVPVAVHALPPGTAVRSMLFSRCTGGSSTLPSVLVLTSDLELYRLVSPGECALGMLHRENGKMEAPEQGTVSRAASALSHFAFVAPGAEKSMGHFEGASMPNWSPAQSSAPAKLISLLDGPTHVLPNPQELMPEFLAALVGVFEGPHAGADAEAQARFRYDGSASGGLKNGTPEAASSSENVGAQEKKEQRGSLQRAEAELDEDAYSDVDVERIASDFAAYTARISGK